jgi:membrane associated rhomboid family serine protease
MTIGLVALNVIAYLYGMTLKSDQLFSEWGLWSHYDPTHAIPGAGTEWWRWISNGFVHENPLHIGMNMFVLVMFGRQVEMLLGRVRFAILYGASLLGSSALVVVLGLAGGPTGGASGAIFGLIAGYIAIAMKLHLPVQSLVLQAGAWLVIGVFVPGLSWQGHLGGALTGWVVTALILRLASRKAAPGSRPA